MLYQFYSEIKFPNGLRTTNSKKINISFQRRVAGVSVVFDEITDELVDNFVPHDFDAIMMGLGHTLYPLILTIDIDGKIRSVANWEEVKKRYEKESKRIITYYENALSVRKYVKASLANISSEEAFIKCIRLSNLFQVIRIGLIHKNSFYYNIPDFPSAGQYCSLSFQKERENEHNEMTYAASDEKIDNVVLSKKGQIYLQRDNKGFINIIQMQCNMEIADEGYYIRRIEIKRIEGQL